MSCSRIHQTDTVEDMNQRPLFPDNNILSTQTICSIFNVSFMLLIVYNRWNGNKYNYVAVFLSFRLSRQ